MKKLTMVRGGPYSGQRILLGIAGTFIFKVKALRHNVDGKPTLETFRGYYNQKGEWVNMKLESHLAQW